MNTIIDELEKIGSDAKLRYADSKAITQLLASAGLSTQDVEAFNRNDSRALEEAVGAQPNICCGLYPVEGDQRAA